MGGYDFSQETANELLEQSNNECDELIEVVLDLRKAIKEHLLSFDEYGDSDFQSIWKSMLKLRKSIL